MGGSSSRNTASSTGNDNEDNIVTKDSSSSLSRPRRPSPSTVVFDTLTEKNPPKVLNTEPIPSASLSSSVSEIGGDDVVEVDEVDEYDEVQTHHSITPKRISLVIALWIAQIVLAISLKRCGVIDHDLNDIVAQRVLPQLEQSFNWSRFNESISAWSRFNETARSMGYITQERQRPGFQLAQKGASGKHPVVMIPGFVTSGLEVWSGKECARKYFRQRMWGGVNSARHFLMERDCFLQHLALDPISGMDPQDIRLRASQGFEAADYFMANYWVWGKIIENLADVGYDASLMSMESYDWRLSFPLLEERDGFLTKLKYKIEAFHKSTGKKAIIATHSLGAILVHYFFAWVTTPENKGGGGGGKKWVDQHVHSYINIAGAQLGVPKAATALLSGEMSDTIMMGPFGTMVEQFFGRKVRKDLWNTWGSVWSMLPKGGEAIWGLGADVGDGPYKAIAALADNGEEEEVCHNDDIDGVCNANSSAIASLRETFPLLFFSDKPRQQQQQDAKSFADDYADSQDTTSKVVGNNNNDNSSNVNGKNTKLKDNVNSSTSDNNNDDTTDVIDAEMYTALIDFAALYTPTVSQTIDFLMKWGGGLGSLLSSPKLHSFDTSNSNRKSSSPTSLSWHDITKTPLPYAPNMKIYCLYGVGIDTERAYFYKRNTDETKESTSSEDNKTALSKKRMIMNNMTNPPFILDTTIDDPQNNVKHGVMYADGDASVPLLSLGYMCADAWLRKDTGLNPSSSKVVTREYKHRQEFSFDDPVRGGPYSADHVDILGNMDMMEDFLKIVTEHEGKELESKIISDIQNIANEINQRGGGLGGRRRQRKQPNNNNKDKSKTKWFKRS